MTGGRQPLAVTSGPRPPGTVDTQNARIRTASIVTGIEPESAQSGGSRALATANASLVMPDLTCELRKLP